MSATENEAYISGLGLPEVFEAFSGSKQESKLSLLRCDRVIERMNGKPVHRVFHDNLHEQETI